MDLCLMGKRIKFARAKQGLTLEKLSERIGISRNFLWEIEDGRKAPAIGTFYNICMELCVCADYLLGFTDEYMTTNNSCFDKKVSDIVKIVNTFDSKEINSLYELLKVYALKK